MIETVFKDNHNTFTVTEEKLRIQIGGFHVSLRENDIKDLTNFLNSSIVRDYKLVKQLIDNIDGQTNTERTRIPSE